VINNPSDCSTRQPLSVGIPFPQSSIRQGDCLRLHDGRGREVALQTKPLAYWHDGGIKWLLLDCLVEAPPQQEVIWEIASSPGDTEHNVLRVTDLAHAFRVETGKATFHLGRQSFQPFQQVEVEGQPLLEDKRSRLVLRDARGRVCTPLIDHIELEDNGPVRATLRFEGHFLGGCPCRFVARVCFFAGTGLVRLRFTVHNPQRARHRNGLWDLGDPGSVLFRSLVLELAVNEATGERMMWRTEAGQVFRSQAWGPLEIYQDSSGGENWQSRNHVNRMGQVPCAFRGYRTEAGGDRQAGLRAEPQVAVCGPSGFVAVAVPEFWQQFPKALAVDEELIRIGLFPEQWADLFELQGGEQKTHTVWFQFGPARSSPEAALGWVHRPISARATPDWYAASQAVEPFSAASNSESRLEAYLREVMTGATSLLASREISDEFGWRNFGEIYADHEAKYYPGPLPLISHYNNQYDVVFGTLLHYLRTGNPDWWALADPLARHVIDIDIYHTSRDKAAYNGGLFWHTDHYKTAGAATHRTYSQQNCPSNSSSYGGGPSSSHNYTTGLMHYYFLTGDANARAAVIELANWVINMDDGRRNILGLVDEGPTGLASCTCQMDYHGPGRGAGNSINALLDAWLITNEHHYLAKADSLIYRCVHPRDDVSARELLNVEARWSYTVFLTALARFLHLKSERRLLDSAYAYAQASLRHYAGWMLENERPYFDQIEKLEYPTEVWAAQELRKANVLRLAAGHADEPQRSRLWQRGEEFADRAWSDLARFESRTVARAAAIVFVEGLRDDCFRANGVQPLRRSAGESNLGSGERFSPQKQRVKSQLTTVRGLSRLGVRFANPKVWWKALRLFCARSDLS
jgi:PcRGLX-like N-terminal RIFT barrel domain